MQVVLPQFGVSDVGDVVEWSAHDRLMLTLAAGCGLLHRTGLRLSLPGPLCKLWRLRDARRELGSQPERERESAEKTKIHANLFTSTPYLSRLHICTHIYSLNLF